MDCSISIGNMCFNIFCYADDLLLASATITGLQAIVNACTDYVECHGLNLNVSKTSWTIIGKTPFTSELMLSGTLLSMENTFKYLGADLGNKRSSTHVAQRIKAANGAFYKLQAAGVHGGGLSPEAVRHIYTLAIQTYGAHAIHLTNTDWQAMERTHAGIIKNSCGLSKFSRTSPLLVALRVESVIKVQTLNLLTRSMSGDSLASTFYRTRYKRGETNGKTLMGRSHTYMKQYGLTLTKAIYIQ